MLPCRPVAMCVTTIGRNMIASTQELVEKEFPGSEVIYGELIGIYILSSLQMIAEAAGVCLFGAAAAAGLGLHVWLYITRRQHELDWADFYEVLADNPDDFNQLSLKSVQETLTRS